MFMPNVEKRDYLLEYAFGAANSSTYGSAVANRGITAAAYCEERYGVPYDPTEHGFKLTIATLTTTFGASSYSIAFESPWWSGTLASSASLFLSTVKIQIDLDGVQHLAACSAWSFSFDEMRLYLVDGFGTRTLLHTIFGDGDAGEDYNPLYEPTHPYLQCNPYLDSTGGEPNCTDYATREDYVYSIDVSATFAGLWKWRTTAGPGSWTEDDLTLASASTPTGNVSCEDCDGTAPSPTGTQSYHFALAAGVTEGISVTDLSDISCFCPGPVLSYKKRYWRFDFNRDQHDYMEAWVVPNNFSIRAHNVRIVEECDDNDAMSSYDHTDTNTDTEAITIWSSQRYKKSASTWCSEQYGSPPIPCAVDIDGNPVDATCDVSPPDPTHCYYGCQVLMSYPTRPPCGPTAFSVDVSTSWRHYKAIVENGNLAIERASNSLADWSSSILSVACDNVAIALDLTSTDQTLAYALDQSGTINLYIAPAESNTLTMATTIGSGTSPAVVVDSGLKFIYRVSGTTIVGKILDAANNVIESDFTAIATVDASSKIDVKCSVQGSGGRRIELYCFVSGSLIEYTSDDGKNFS